MRPVAAVVVLVLLAGLVAAAAVPGARVPDDMVAVPAGAFVMGAKDGEADERPAHRVTLSAFLLDRDEVTVAAYGRCVADAACRAATHPIGGPAEPMTWVSWDDATRYCRWAKKRLPSEAEWEYAARGPGGRIYPWGDEPACDRANFGNYRGEGRCPQNAGHPVAVGSYARGASPFGARDLAGNVWEWVNDRYDARYYARSPAQDPRGPQAPRASTPARRVVRGGACCSMFGLPRAANRLAFPADYGDEDIGFRCAR